MSRTQEKTNAGGIYTGQDSVLKAARRSLAPRRIGSLFGRGAAVLKARGAQALWREIDFRIRLAAHAETWRYRADIPLNKELRAQKKEAEQNGASWPKISVIAPLYNTPPKYLKQMVNSVRRQSYQNWQLVLVNASDENHPQVGAAAGAFAKKDSRIRLVTLKENLGISGNTNAGIAQSSGEVLTFLDHDDALQPNAFYEAAQAVLNGADLVYSDEAVLDENLEKLWEFHFKADYAPDTLRGCNYITHFCAFTRALIETAGGGEKEEFDGAQDYDLILRLTEKAKKIVHLPKVLYFWRRHSGSTASGIGQKPKAALAGQAALAAHLRRAGLAGQAQAQQNHPGAYRVQYEIEDGPLVSVIIPSYDHTDDLEKCLSSLYKRAGWPHMEVIVAENNSKKPETWEYYKKAQKQYPNLSVVEYKGRFNYSDINNFAEKHAQGQHLLLLNNDVEILSDGFVKEMLSYSRRADVGAVGAMLYYPDDTVQHAGLIVGLGGTAGVSHKGHKRGDGGDMFRLCTTQNVSAVTGAALMVKRSLYNKAGGLDEKNFAVAFNDVDFCLTLQKMGYWNVFTPFAFAYHHESKSRGYDLEGENKTRFDAESARFKAKWADILEKGDPFYNPHFTLEFENFGYR